jgi:hypothetical protein
MLNSNKKVTRIWQDQQDILLCKMRLWLHLPYKPKPLQGVSMLNMKIVSHSKRNKKVAHIWQDQQNFLLGTHQNQFGQRYYSECEPPLITHQNIEKQYFFLFPFFFVPTTK